MNRTRLFAPAAALVALLGACAAGPDYVKPGLDMPVAWKTEAPWRESAPDDAAAKGPWWQRFGDARAHGERPAVRSHNAEHQVGRG